jgi:hypothetical protein
MHLLYIYNIYINIANYLSILIRTYRLILKSVKIVWVCIIPKQDGTETEIICDYMCITSWMWITACIKKLILLIL